MAKNNIDFYSNRGKYGMWNPYEIATVAWYDASDTGTITEDTGAVSQLNDKSGNGNHLAQGVSANQPSTGIDTVNGLNTITFASGDKLAVGANIFATSTVTELFAITVTTITQAVAAGFTVNHATGGGGSMSSRLPFFSAIINDYGSNTYRDQYNHNITPPGDIMNAIQYDGVGGEGKRWHDGELTPNIEGAEPSITSVNDTSIEDIGNLAEWIIIEGIVSDSDRQKLEGYLAWKWGLEANLPTSHPYRYNMPRLS
jgi:hypothetical protein